MDDIGMENAILAQLRFGIGDIAKQMELIEQMAKQTAINAQNAFKEASVLAPVNTQTMTAQQAMVARITAEGETQRQAILNESNAKIAKMEADAEYKRTATQAKASQARINQARVETAELQTLAAAGKLEGIENANRNMLEANAAAQQRLNEKAIANLELTEARKQAVIDESNTKQILAREKTDAAILQSAAKTQAQIDNIESRTGINTAKAGVYDTRADILMAESAAKVDAVNAKTLASIEKTEAQKAIIVGKGEAQISQIQAKEALTRQQIAQKEAATQLAIIKQQLAQEQVLYMQSRRAAFESKPTGMAGLMERRMSWLGTGALVMGGFTGIAETVQTIKDVEMGMTTIARVTEDAAFNFKGMRDELQQLGVTYGDTWGDISDIAIRWAQAGYNQAETLELTKDSLLALNTAELNAEQATSGLIAVMAQWGLTADELLPVIDKINKVADDFAITSTDLVSGLQRSSGAAKVLGLSLEETIAILTTMREATGRTGKEVGNALNSILSFMQRDKAIDTFEDMGIRVFADEARTEFRNVIEIFDEMASKWPNMSEVAKDAFTSEAEAAGLFNEEMADAVGMQEQWNDMQQRDLSQAAAGIYRRNYLLALLQNWSMVDEVLISQEQSLGYSMKENERTMQTLEKQIEVLKASAEQLAVALGDAGLLREITGLVEGVTDAVQWFNNLDDDMQMALLTLLEVTAAVKLLTVAFKGLGISGAMASAGGLMAGWAVPIGATTAATRSLMSTLTGVSALLTNVGKGAIAAFGGPVAVGIIAVSTAAIAVARSVASANEELIAHGAIAENMIVEYDRLSEKLDGISKGTDEYAQTAKELNTVKGQIADSLPEVIDGWEKESDSVKINREEMERLIATSKDLKKSQEELTDSMEDSLKIMQAEVAEYNKKAQEWESEANVLQDLAERRDKLTESLSQQKEGSEEARKTEEALGETERLIADIAQEAGLKRNATVDAIMDKLNELEIAQNNLVIKTQKDELKKVDAVKQGSLARLAIIEEELAAYDDPSSWGFIETVGNFVQQINPLNFLNKDPKYLNQGNLEKEKVKSVQAAKEAQRQKEAIERAIKDAERNIAGINADATTGNYPPPNPDADKKGKKTDLIKQGLDELSFASKQAEMANAIMESSLSRLSDQLNTAGAEYDHLSGKIESGTATSADYARMQELVGIKMGLVEDEQVKLAQANMQYQQQINALNPLLAKATAEYERFKAAGDFEHMEDAQSAAKDLQSEIDSLSSTIASNTQKIWDNKGALEELATTAYSGYYQSMMSWMQHMESIGRLSTQQQLDYLSGIDETMLKQSEAWKLEEDRFSERRALLDEEMDKIKDAYDEQMQQYEDEIEANDKLIERKEKQAEAAVSAIDDEIAAIQRLMDLLDDDAEAEDREEAERQHNKKLAELAEERLYHELRTGLEHQEAITDIDKQIAEENRAWQLQQNDWAREDQKEAYQDQIDVLKDKQKAIEKSSREEINQLKTQNDRKKQEMQEYYNELEKLLNDHTLDMLATLGSANEDMYQKGLDWMKNLAKGIKDGQTELPSGFKDFVSDVESDYDDLPSDSNAGRPSAPQPQQKLVATVSPNQVRNIGGTYTLPSRTLAGLLDESAEWDQQRQQVRIGGKWFSPLANDNGTTYVGIRQVAEALGYITKYIGSTDSVQIWDKAHDGAKVMTSGIAELRHDERVLSPSLAPKFDLLASALLKAPDISKLSFSGDYSSLERKLDTLIGVMKNRNLTVDKAVNIEHASFEDKADMQAFGIEVRSMLSAIG